MPNFTSPLPKTKIAQEGSSELKLTVVAVGDIRPIVTWYRNGILANSTSFVITNKEIGTNAKSEIIVQSNLMLKLPNRKSNAVFLAKAAYGAVSPMANTSTFVDVWCKYFSTDILSLFVDFLFYEWLLNYLLNINLSSL